MFLRSPSQTPPTIQVGSSWVPFLFLLLDGKPSQGWTKSHLHGTPGASKEAEAPGENGRNMISHLGV